jgi:glycosyltransferase involved in cell wall biosynthesis
VSVVIPTLNEQESIGKVLSAIPNQLVDEVLVVDGSSDMTARIAEGFGARIVREPRRGYGRALQTAIENATGDIVVYMDGDFTYDPSDIIKLIGPVQDGNLDGVLGNRFMRDEDRRSMPFLNRLGNRILSSVFRRIFGTEINDTQCGMRAFTRQVLLKHRYSSLGMAYVTEQLAKLVKSGCRLGEVPIGYRSRVGQSKLHRFRDGFTILWTMFRERLQS